MESRNSSLKYEGYLIDLIKEISTIMDFDYNLTVGPLSSYGSCFYFNDTCDGLKNKVKNGEVDIALVLAWIASYEMHLMDFTIPFYESSGLKILMKKPTKPVAIFKFLTVFEGNVWLTILAMYFLTIVLLQFYDLKSPFSYRNNRLVYANDDLEKERIFSIRESSWFGLMCLMAEGGGATPRSK